MKSGLHLMAHELKRGLVYQIAGRCQNSARKVRSAALGVMLKALQGKLYAKVLIIIIIYFI